MSLLRAVLILVALLFLLSPASAQDWNSQAVALQTRQDWNGLRNLAERWTKAEPRNFGAWADLGVACDMLQQHQQAAQAYERSLDLQPNGMMWMQLAADYHLLRQPDKLKALYERLQKSNPHGAATLATQFAAARNVAWRCSAKMNNCGAALAQRCAYSRGIYAQGRVYVSFSRPNAS